MSNRKFRNKAVLVNEYAGKTLSRHRFRFGFKQSHVIEIREKEDGAKFAKLPMSLVKEIKKTYQKHPKFRTSQQEAMMEVTQAYDVKVREFVDYIMVTEYGSVDGKEATIEAIDQAADSSNSGIIGVDIVSGGELGENNENIVINDNTINLEHHNRLVDGADQVGA